MANLKSNQIIDQKYRNKNGIFFKANLTFLVRKCHLKMPRHSLKKMGLLAADAISLHSIALSSQHDDLF